MEEAAGRRSPGELEQDIYTVLAQAGSGGSSVQQVIDTVDPTLAYTTVMTTLNRLVARGVLGRRRVGRQILFTAGGDPDAVLTSSTAARMNRLLATVPDRSKALAQFVAGLSPEDEARLTALLNGPATGPASGVRR